MPSSLFAVLTLTCDSIQSKAPKSCWCVMMCHWTKLVTSSPPLSYYVFIRATWNSVWPPDVHFKAMASSHSAAEPSFSFPSNRNAFTWVDLARDVKNSTWCCCFSHTGPKMSTLLLVCWYKYHSKELKCVWEFGPWRRRSEKRSDGWGMSTLWRSELPRVWTPIIYRQSSNPCQRAVSCWADLSRSSVSALTALTRPLHGTRCTLSLLHTPFVSHSHFSILIFCCFTSSFLLQSFTQVY